MRLCALSLALLLAAPAWAGEPVDLKAGEPAPYAGTLTESTAWVEAAQRRMELESRLSALEAHPCPQTASPVVWGLVLGGALFVGGVILGALVLR